MLLIVEQPFTRVWLQHRFGIKTKREVLVVIEMESVAYSYGEELLSELDISISQGSFYFLTGPSGSGKTTFLKMCYGSLIPTSGKLSVFGKDSSSLLRDEIAHFRRKIGVVHQDCQFLDHLNVADNIALPIRVSARNSLSDSVNLKELLNWVGLSHRSKALPPELSGGERQRAALARAIIMSPDVILADEPTGNIDWEMSQRLIRLLIELNHMGKTIVIATHDLNLIRFTKASVQARVLRISNKTVQLAGSDL